jgi:hypothetical protein
MSLSQTYLLAHQARSKLSTAAAKADHQLRILVGHANMLDSLMLQLAEAEQEQEAWFNQTVKGAAKEEAADKHIQWADTIVEEPEQDWAVEDAESSDSDSDYSEDDDEEFEIPLRSQARPITTPISITATELDEEEYSDDEEDFESLSLTRTQSHTTPIPQLVHSDDDDSEDESMPPSPPQPTFELSEKQRKQIATTSFYDSASSSKSTDRTLSEPEQAAFLDEGYYLPQRTSQPMISAF